MKTPTPGNQTASDARWIFGRVITVRPGFVAVTLNDDVEHVISREQAIALGTRLLEVGIGTTFHEERAINAGIGDLIQEARANVR